MSHKRIARGIPRKALYTAQDLRGLPHLNSGPGEVPYLRGPYASMYTAKPWTLRQYAGFAGAKASNAFFRSLLAGGAQGLSVAFDLPTHRGYDSDHPAALADVGLTGVAIDCVDDMQRLFDGIALDKVSVSMTMSGAVLPVLGCFILAGRAQGLQPEKLSGTIQNDILKEFQVRNTYIHAPAPSLRIAADVVDYVARHMPRFNSMSISGYHFQEAGADGVLELAMTLANAREYLRAFVARGLDVDAFCRTLSFFFGVGMDFYGEIAKLRAARVLWSDMVAAHGGRQARSMAMRMHCQTSGWSLAAQAPLNNITRTTVEAMAAVFGGTQSLHTNAFDEALALPSDDAARIARDTQLILQQETGLRDVVDPWAGSYVMESLTADMCKAVRDVMREIDEEGGVLAALDSGWLTRRIHILASRCQAEIDTGARPVVGMNVHAAPQPGPRGDTRELEPPSAYPDSACASAGTRAIDGAAVRAEQLARLASLRARRDGAAVVRALDELENQARSGSGNLLVAVMAALSADASVGECTAALERVWPRYQPRSDFVSGVYGAARDGDAADAGSGIQSDDEAWARARHAVARLARDGRPPSILLVKLGQDGHDRGIKAVAGALADAGFRVHMGALFETPEGVVQLARDLAVDALGVSTLAGAHRALLPRVAKCLRDAGLGRLPLLAGGVIPEADQPALRLAGVSAIFGPGATMPDISLALANLLANADVAGGQREYA
ncbi:methylmalonyl-CoA mutase [Bordetella sp. N]|uniref:methylmalonyl-CoA mutase n=1 Tax=Bordetella sp. N TaxID=1746199 RepID=UPI000708FBFD|nr:methylmalonyl-CoA mutase [Bordetella sp. N]ALM83301.1 methylmalonyl-CoA mutase [Bordetella sp. N]